MGEAIRIGLGSPSGMRSDSWSVRMGSDGSVYVAPRMRYRAHRGAWKASLHPRRDDGTGGRWKIEYQRHYVQAFPGQFEDKDSKLLDDWDSESQKLPPTDLLSQGFGIVLGRFSLGPHIPLTDASQSAADLRYLEKANWLEELPPINQAYQWTVLIGDPGVVFTPPGTGAMEATPVGTLLGGRRQLWVMRHSVELTPELQGQIARHADAIASHADRSKGPHVLRGTTFHAAENGFRYVMEIAVSIGFETRDLQALFPTNDT